MLVTFPLVTDANGFVQYPDKIEFFSNTQIAGDDVIADYSGSQTLTPYTPPAIAANTKITRLAYLNRLEPELKAIYALAQTDIDIQIYKDKVLASDYLDLSDPAVIADLNKLQVAGIYTPQRIDEILNAPPTKREGFIE